MGRASIPLFRKHYYDNENSKWERNRLLHSGMIDREQACRVFVRGEDMDSKEEDEDFVGSLEGINLIARDVIPEFLQAYLKSSNLFSGVSSRFPLDSATKMSQLINFLRNDTVLPVKDPASDIAKFSRKGSYSLRLYKDLKEQESKMRSLEGGIFQDEQKKERLKLKNHNHKKSTKERPGVENKTSDLSIRELKENIPSFSVKESLLRTIRENSVVIVMGETGSGKTTQLTQYLYEDGYGEFGMIGCTQPRRVAAVSVAKRVSEEMGVSLGKEVGYSIRFEDNCSSKTVIKYMTDGVLLRESLKGNLLGQYSVIIMDEAHERSLQTDILLGVLKNIAVTRRDLKIIITSATMDTDRFVEFFGGSSPVFSIPGRTFPVNIIYNRHLSEDYIDSAVRKVLEIHAISPMPSANMLCNCSDGYCDHKTSNMDQKFQSGDILVFMTGQEDIETTCYLIEDGLGKMDNAKPLNILPVYSQLSSDLQSRIFEKSNDGIRRCIVATNIAETSITLEGVTYVVDSGYCKLKVYNSKVGMDTLSIFPISQASAKQRSGRAGRTSPGICYRLYPESVYDNDLFPTTLPEISRTNLSNTLLLLLSLGISNIMEFPFIDSPPLSNIVFSMYNLWMLEAVNSFGKITDLGRQMVEFPVDPTLSKMIVSSFRFGCSVEICIIVSCLSVPFLFSRNKGAEGNSNPDAEMKRSKFAIMESDHLTLLNIFIAWATSDFREDWAINNDLNYRNLVRSRDILIQIIEIVSSMHERIYYISSHHMIGRVVGFLRRSVKRAEFVFSGKGESWDVVRKTICLSYFGNVAKNKSFDTFVNIRTGFPTSLHPSSSLYDLGSLPSFVVYHDLLFTTKQFMYNVTKVEPHWLATLAPLHFSIENLSGHENEDPRYRKILDIEHKIETIKAQMLEDDENPTKDSSAQTDARDAKRKSNTSVKKKTHGVYGQGHKRQKGWIRPPE